MAKTNNEEKKSSGAFSEAKRVALLFLEDRTYEMKVGDFTETFEGKQLKEVPTWVINHDDWANESLNFAVFHKGE